MSRYPIRLRWILLLSLLLPLFVNGCQPIRDTVAHEEANAELLAHDFRLATLDGQSITLSELRGRWVLINFWATWCVPCREEMPYLQALADKYASQLTILAINMREQPAEIHTFVDELGLSFPILLQPDSETLLAYNVRGLPLSYVVSPTGEVRLHQAGPFSIDDFERWLSEKSLFQSAPP